MDQTYIHDVYYTWIIHGVYSTVVDQVLQVGADWVQHYVQQYAFQFDLSNTLETGQLSTYKASNQ